MPFLTKYGVRINPAMPDNTVMNESTATDTIHDPAASQRQAVRSAIVRFAQQVKDAGHDFRAPPEEPTSCCGRGCHGCVWEGYEAALNWWYEEGGELLNS